MQSFIHIKGTFRPILAKSILFAYLLSILGLLIESSHSHESNTTKCNADHHATSVDPCHLRLDHHDLLNGCKHSEHISKTKPHCLLCDLLLHFDVSIVSKALCLFIDTSFEVKTYELDYVPVIKLIGLKNKAPPVLIS
ncbi:MAG: hypothetical protein IPI45_05640 [Saprospiraceae bacterium]|nr:hypothetical protein [Saprospiraceae bacterium]MBK7737242.1 hypothetical protein [Saprospiraceae bacterium]MBK7914164.1 hypothetical protein [Saprospiraceae bacterium]